MERRWCQALALAGAIGVVALPAAAGWGGHLGRGAASVPLTLLYWGCGVLVWWRRREHRAARRLLAFGSCLAIAFGLGSIASACQTEHVAPGWSWAFAIALDAVDWLVFLAMLALCAVFPDGGYHRVWERRVVRSTGAALPVLVLLRVTGEQHPRTTSFTWVDEVGGPNPLAVPAMTHVGDLADVAAKASLVLLALGVVVLVVRYRRFQDARRRQTAWPLLAFALTLASFVVLGALSPVLDEGPLWVGYLTYYVVLSLLPLGLLIGMLRHRLLDVDLVVRRSLVYGLLWVVIAVAYVGVAAALGELAGRRLSLDVAVLLTILVTLVVAPARRWLERGADRLVFGRRLSGYALINGLGAVLEASPPPEQVAGAVAGAVRTGLRLDWARVVADGVPVATAGRVSDGTPALVVPLLAGETSVGSIECGPRSRGRFREGDRELVEALAGHAGLAIGHALLTSELGTRLQELEASRGRLVRAEDAARRRLERDIHDGVQQELVVVLTRMALVRRQLRHSVDAADTLLADVQRDTRRALENLQELSRGIHPPVLTDRGLVEAVEERASRMTVPVSVRVQGLDGHRLPREVETAAYFVVSEALANVLKHGRSSAVTICLSCDETGLVVEVQDDGVGFDPEHTGQRGLAGLRDRLDSLGGGLRVEAAPGAGCRLTARLPAVGAAHA